MNLTEKQLNIIYYALKIASEYADDIDVFELKDDGQDYTHSSFENDCIELMGVINKRKEKRGSQPLCIRCKQFDCSNWEFGRVVECQDFLRC